MEAVYLVVYSLVFCIFVIPAGIEPTSKEPESFILSIKLRDLMATQKYKIILSFCPQYPKILQELFYPLNSLRKPSL